MVRARHDAGQATLELVLGLPLVVAALLACVQVFVAAHTGLLAHDAALAALRAHRAGDDAERAARAVLGPDRVAGLRLRTDDDESTVEVDVPRLLPLPEVVLTVRRTVTAGPEVR